MKVTAHTIKDLCKAIAEEGEASDLLCERVAGAVRRIIEIKDNPEASSSVIKLEALLQLVRLSTGLNAVLAAKQIEATAAAVLHLAQAARAATGSGIEQNDLAAEAIAVATALLKTLDK